MPRKVKPKVVYRKLPHGVVGTIYNSKYRSHWLSNQHVVPIRQVSLIRKAATLEEAINEHGY